VYLCSCLISSLGVAAYDGRNDSRDGHTSVHIYCVQTICTCLYLILFFCCSFINVELLERKYYAGDQIKRNEMAVACGMYRGVESCVLGFSEKT
jgi:hypothetical protein